MELFEKIRIKRVALTGRSVSLEGLSGFQSPCKAQALLGCGSGCRSQLLLQHHVGHYVPTTIIKNWLCKCGITSAIKDQGLREMLLETSDRQDLCETRYALQSSELYSTEPLFFDALMALH